MTVKIDTENIIDFFETVWSRWGIPEDITTDNGTQFRQEFSQYLCNKGIKHKKTPLYCPQINENIERFNRTLKEGISAHLANGWNFKDAIHQVISSYRSMYSDITGRSPAQLMTGHPMRTSMATLKPTITTTEVMDSDVAVRIKKNKEKSKKYQDQKKRNSKERITTGDWV